MEEIFAGAVKMLAVKGYVKLVALLRTIPGCGPITAWTIRAYVDDIRRFSSPQKFASYAGLSPWVHGSNTTVHIGHITKRGPKELRTVLVQLVMGILRLTEKTAGWRLMSRYRMMKRNKGNGVSIRAFARKLVTIIWTILVRREGFNERLMTDPGLKEKGASMQAGRFGEGTAEVQLAAVAIGTGSKLDP
jgi:transposase